MHKPAKSQVVIWALMIVLIIFVVLSIFLRRAEEPYTDPPEKAVPVSILHIQPKQVDDLVKLPGRLEAYTRSRLAVDKGGRVVELLVDRGDTVSADEELLRIDDRVWRALHDLAVVEREDARREWNRWTQLAATETVSTSELDRVRTRLDRANVQVQEAEIHVAQCTVRSPRDGVINDRFIEVGEFAPEGAAVLELVVTDPIKLIIDIPERDVKAVRVGDTLLYRIQVIGPETFTGTVAHVATAGATHNNTFRAELVTDNADGRLRPGMIATVDLLRARREAAIVIPLAAVIPRQGEHFVFLQDEQRAIRRLVKIDRILGTEVVLAEGLADGDRLIVEGHRELIDGALIEVVEPETDTADPDNADTIPSTANEGLRTWSDKRG